MKSAPATDNVMIKIWKFTEFTKKQKVIESVKKSSLKVILITFIMLRTYDYGTVVTFSL